VRTASQCVRLETDESDVAAGDGVYSYEEIDGSITLSDVRKNSTRTLVRGDAVTDVSLLNCK
jgi:hypothetical protein